jgi:tetratricopeptide (TPR) repeat protein
MTARNTTCLRAFAVLCSSIALAQVQQLGTIAGQLRTANGDTPSHQVMVELTLHGATVNEVYADAEGHFGFTNLDADSYHVLVRDESYDLVDELVSLRPESPIANLRILLQPRKGTKQGDALNSQPSGGNPFMVDPRNYNARFPKKAIKEYEKGVEADGESKRDVAIARYEAALKLAPSYYPAHNNLGSDYLAKNDPVSARKEFEKVVELNQSDSEAYFNLTNVCLVTGQLDDAQRYLGEGLRRNPESSLGQFLRGSLSMRQGKYDEAETTLRHVIQLNPNLQQAHLQLVNLYLERGRLADAATELQAFVAAFPQSPFTPKARQLLEKLGKGQYAKSK